MRSEREDNRRTTDVPQTQRQALAFDQKGQAEQQSDWLCVSPLSLYNLLIDDETENTY